MQHNLLRGGVLQRRGPPQDKEEDNDGAGPGRRPRHEGGRDGGRRQLRPGVPVAEGRGREEHREVRGEAELGLRAVHRRHPLPRDPALRGGAQGRPDRGLGLGLLHHRLPGHEGDVHSSRPDDQAPGLGLQEVLHEAELPALPAQEEQAEDYDRHDGARHRVGHLEHEELGGAAHLRRPRGVREGAHRGGEVRVRGRQVHLARAEGGGGQ